MSARTASVIPIEYDPSSKPMQDVLDEKISREQLADFLRLVMHLAKLTRLERISLIPILEEDIGLADLARDLGLKRSTMWSTCNVRALPKIRVALRRLGYPDLEAVRRRFLL